MPDDFALKDYITRDSTQLLAEHIHAAHRQFEVKRFVNASCRGLAPLEFTQRTQHIAKQLRHFLPESVPRSLKIISKCLPDPLPAADGMFSQSFWLWPLSDFIRDYGGDHWEESLDACYQLTQRFTAEFAIRPQLSRRPQPTLSRLQEWTSDSSEHVRRLCSEGTRPRLPWAPRLDLPRDSVLPILESLQSDPARYVQRSVANHLNDLGKDDSSWLLKVMRSWMRSKDPATDWIVRHALRSLIKAGDPSALKIIGYSKPNIERITFRVTPKRVSIGSPITAKLQLSGKGKKPQPLRIDWVLHYPRPGRESYRKVFIGKETTLEPNATFECQKRFDMKPRNTRRLYPGVHRLEVQANGDIVAAAQFRLTET